MKKVFVYISEYGHPHVLNVNPYRLGIWDVLFGKNTDYQFSDWRANEELPEYSMREWLDLSFKEYMEAIEAYTQSRGLPALLEIEE